MAEQPRIINREISWLSFNDRVLQEAADKIVPLVERLRFLGIFSSNLDEFFKVRVATIKRMIDLGEGVRKKYDDNPKRLLSKIQSIVLQQQKKFHDIYQNIIMELGEKNIFIVDETKLNPQQGEFVTKYFYDEIMPVLSPIMLKHLEEFPQLQDKTIYFAVKLMHNNRNSSDEYALIELPEEQPRFLVLPVEGDKKYIILVDDVIRYCLMDVFATFKFDKIQAYTIKVTRDAELDIDNDLTKSFLEKVQKGINKRRRGQPVRFVYDSTIPKDLLNYFIKKLQLDSDDNLIPGGRYHNFKDFMKFPNVGDKSLEYNPEPPLMHPAIKPRESILNTIQEKDVLLHVPYQSFLPFINMLREAAIDPSVESIKTTLYRVARNSKVTNALINASRNGKNVTVVIELRARFDEQSNIYWAKKMEEAGVKIIFGMQGLKVHSKLTLITRRINNKKIHVGTVGTGNFHEGTARVYADVLLMTGQKKITSEIKKVFDFFDTNYKFGRYKELLISPLILRRKFSQLIDNEIDNAKQGKEAYIIVKTNSLIDKGMIYKLYEANNAGVKIKMIIRGMCSLIPGVPGMSENIEVISILGRYLEHSRVWAFCNGGDEKYYIGSADWMPRNIDNRVEVVAPVYDKQAQKELRMMLELQLSDNVKARIINEKQDNPYKRDDNPNKIRSQFALYEYYQDQSKEN